MGWRGGQRFDHRLSASDLERRRNLYTEAEVILREYLEMHEADQEDPSSLHSLQGEYAVLEMCLILQGRFIEAEQLLRKQEADIGIDVDIFGLKGCLANVLLMRGHTEEAMAMGSSSSSRRCNGLMSIFGDSR